MQSCLIRRGLLPLRAVLTRTRPSSSCLLSYWRLCFEINTPSPTAQFHFHYSGTAVSVRWGSSATPTKLSEMMSAEEGGEVGERRSKWGRGEVWKIKQKRYTRHITNLVRKGKVEEAEQVFQDMLSAEVRPNTVTFNNLIAGLSRHGNADQAFKYFNDLKKRGLLPTDHTYASLFRACAQTGPSSRQLLEKVVSEIDRRGYLLNTIATNSLIVAMTICEMIDEAFQAYFDLSKHGQMPDVSTFTALTAACGCDRERGLERAVHVWQEMAASRIEPDLIFFNTLLQCVREAGVCDDTKQHNESEVVIPALSVEHLSSIFTPSTDNLTPPSSMARYTNSQGARHPQRSAPFKVVSKNRLPLSIFGAQVTVHITSSGWKWMDSESVTEFLRLLRERDLTPNIHTLNHLSQMAVDWVAMVREMGVVTGSVPPDKKCLNAAVRLQAQLGNARGAEVLRVFGEESGMSVGLAGYRSLAVSCNHRQQGLRLLAQMKEDGVIPDQHTIGTLLGNAASRHDYEYLIALMKEMRHCKMRPNGSMALILRKMADSQVSQSPRMKLRFNGFKGYYTLWKRHYSELDT